MTDATRKPLAHRLNQVPLTVWLVLTVGVVFCWPWASHFAEYDRSLVGAGEVWRIVTCHLTHWNLDHLFWDTFALAVLGVMCERRTRAGWLTSLGIASVAIPLAIFFLQPEMETYRGLSGVDTALFSMLAIVTLHESWYDRDWKWLTVVCAFLAGFAGKIAFELTTGGTVFVDSAAGDFTPAPLAHLFGILVGGLVGAMHVRMGDVKGRVRNWCHSCGPVS
jgi:rhomboid family GlyGly-CTERM serine protease